MSEIRPDWRAVVVMIVVMIFIDFACSVDHENSPPTDSTHPINQELKLNARNIFGDKIQQRGSYEGRSSHFVIYSIPDHQLSLEDFNHYHTHIFEKNNWNFLRKKGPSYIYCQGTRQLEIVPPKSLMINRKNERGDGLVQLDNEWNINFEHESRKGTSICYYENYRRKN